ncbi:Uncharacterized protein TCM_043823 [Theobroma cacao]|uniref:Uncharacterized protein n=1 Tax=Theobroma cacao TaxID=3641 RepID=A0A061FP55_THECC|nr:Uncharacterized protein TCM_043823 [Theobroma cacao]
MESKVVKTGLVASWFVFELNSIAFCRARRAFRSCAGILLYSLAEVEGPQIRSSSPGPMSTSITQGALSESLLQLCSSTPPIGLAALAIEVPSSEEGSYEDS